MTCSDVKVTAALQETVVVGATRVASKLRGLNIKEYLQPRNFSPREVVFAERSGKPTQAFSGEGR